MILKQKNETFTLYVSFAIKFLFIVLTTFYLSQNSFFAGVPLALLPFRRQQNWNQIPFTIALNKSFYVWTGNRKQSESDVTEASIKSLNNNTTPHLRLCINERNGRCFVDFKILMSVFRYKRAYAVNKCISIVSCERLYAWCIPFADSEPIYLFCPRKRAHYMNNIEGG